MNRTVAHRRDGVDLTVFFPAGHTGSQRVVARMVSQSTGVPQSLILVDRCPESEIGSAIAAGYLRPWTDDYVPMQGWTPYLVVSGAEVYEGQLDRDVDQSEGFYS